MNWNYNQTRSWIGSSKIAYPDDYIVVDIETTGLDPNNNEIIEISAVRYSDNQRVAEFNSLLKPSMPISDEIITLTGITNVMLEEALEPAIVLKDFYDFVSDDKDQKKIKNYIKLDNPVLMAYNAPFDVTFLYDKLLEYHGLYLNHDYVDVLRLARKLCPGRPRYRQVDMADYFDIATKGAHRAGEDTRMCNAIYQRLKEIARLGYKEPKPYRILELAPSQMEACPLAGHSFYVCGAMEQVTKYNLKSIIYGLGGTVDGHLQEHTDNIIIGLGNKSILDEEEIKQAVNIKNNVGGLKIFKENTFVEGMLAKKYVRFT